MEELFTLGNFVAFLSLTSLEIVLGIDNIIFVAILSERAQPHLRARARSVGISAAMISRILLLLAISWVMRLNETLFSVAGRGISGHDLILIVGGLFLIGKATREVHESLEPDPEENGLPQHVSFWSVIGQVMVLDIVFSLDSVITAVGLVDSVAVMVSAIVTAVGVMLIFAGRISEFIKRHPTVKMLALSFLLLVGVTLVLEGCGKEVDKAYIYFAMLFSLAVEMLNIRASKNKKIKKS